MLIQNIRITDRLCNGTLLKIIGLYKYNIKAEIITRANKYIYLQIIGDRKGNGKRLGNYHSRRLSITL